MASTTEGAIGEGAGLAIAGAGLAAGVLGPLALPLLPLLGGGIGEIFGIGNSNSKARDKKREQEKHNQEVADRANIYNKEADLTEKANYELMREYSHDTSIRNWERGKEIQDYEYLHTLKRYEKSYQIAEEQGDLNNQRVLQAVEAENASIENMFIQQQFDRESQLTALKGVYTEGNLNIKEQGVKMLGIESKQRLGSAGINNQIETLMKKGSFDRTNAMVEGLITEGRSAMGQAGKSKAKRQQSASAALHRGLMGLETELTGKRKQAGIELAQLSAETSLSKTGVGLNIERIKNSIATAEADAEYNNRVMNANMKSFISQAERNVNEILLQKQVADLNVRASTMIKPEKLSYDPEPQLPPERIFLARQEVMPGYVPQPAQQNQWAPLISGISQAAGVLSGVDFGGGGGGGGGPKPGDQFGSLFTGIR